MPSALRSLHLSLLCLLLAMPGYASEMAVDAEKREIAIALATEPPSLNSVKATDAESSRILDHISEGLLGYDADNRLSGGVAQRWELSPQGATFHLRRDALWDDGVAVTANDFVFAWREVVRPGNAAQYAPLMFPIRNARRINAGELEPAMLGVRALDDHTLRVEFEEPCAYFLGLTAYITYRPIREDVYRRFGERYAAEAGNLRSNGPFRLSEWVHGARLRLERNPQYWNVAAVALNAINVPYITEEPSSTFNLFKDDKIALAPLDDSTMREALARRMNVKRFIDGAQLYIEFNHRPGRPTRNRHLRKALQLAFDPTPSWHASCACPATSRCAACCRAGSREKRNCSATSTRRAHCTPMSHWRASSWNWPGRNSARSPRWCCCSATRRRPASRPSICRTCTCARSASN
ncbi:MAG: peptide ABC transporter substrate-binding protein [Gammaproteobacteria bacterium]|nr:peptide ABC transporter substrate-binding protein [Gammaproteobacteria bacterium]